MLWHNMNVRNGITPVVSIVLLLMLTVAVAGGAYAWIDGIIQERYEQASRTVNTDITVKDMQCYADSGEVSFYLKNSGDVTVDRSDIDVYLYKVSDGSLADVVPADQTSALEPGEAWNSEASAYARLVFDANEMMIGRKYRVRFEFTNERGYAVSHQCDAR